jgi:serine/threonine protein kinase
MSLYIVVNVYTVCHVAQRAYTCTCTCRLLLADCCLFTHFVAYNTTITHTLLLMLLLLHSHTATTDITCSHNVLITDDCRAVLTDFGLSKTASTITGMTQSCSAFHGGTLAWTAPEVLNAHDEVSCFTAKSDVYSYGVVVWEVLCSGATPWQNVSSKHIVVKAVSGERPAVDVSCVHDTNVSDAARLTALMVNCLKGEPCERPDFTQITAALQLQSSF